MRTSKNISNFIRETVRKLMQIGHKGVYEFIEYMEILQYGHQFEVNKPRSDVLVAGFEHNLFSGYIDYYCNKRVSLFIISILETISKKVFVTFIVF